MSSDCSLIKVIFTSSQKLAPKAQYKNMASVYDTYHKNFPGIR